MKKFIYPPHTFCLTRSIQKEESVIHVSHLRCPRVYAQEIDKSGLADRSLPNRLRDIFPGANYCWSRVKTGTSRIGAGNIVGPRLVTPSKNVRPILISRHACAYVTTSLSASPRAVSRRIVLALSLSSLANENLAGAAITPPVASLLRV